MAYKPLFFLLNLYRVILMLVLLSSIYIFAIVRFINVKVVVLLNYLFMDQQELLELIRGFNGNWVGPILSAMLLGTGLYLTIRLGVIQRYFLRAIRTLLGSGNEGRASKTGITPFQALSTSVASQVGTGNVVGVATALMAGGPGALFWLWISTFFGMSTNFSEAILGQLYRTEREGHAVGGPAFYIEQGLRSKALAIVFSLFAIIALGLMGTVVQANTISEAMSSLLPDGVNRLYIGIGLAIVTMSVLAGGVTRIASFSERVVPMMAGVFILGAIIFIFMHIHDLPRVIGDIFKYAFTPWAAAGGVLGAVVMDTIRYGISRGLFSNEAGLGSTPHAHAIAQVSKPYEQGLTAIVGVGTTLVICTLSGLVILLSGVMEVNPHLKGISIAQTAFSSAFGSFGSIFIAVALLFFAFTTIVGWYFFAAQNVRYLFGDKMIWPFRIMVAGMILLASVAEVKLIWELADTCNFFLVIPNVIALLCLSPKVIAQAKQMRQDIKEEKKQ